MSESKHVPFYNEELSVALRTLKSALAERDALKAALRELYLTEAIYDDGDERLENARTKARAALAATEDAP